MKPTDEQQDAIDLFHSGLGLAIEAGAGTGKTSTLRLLADETDRTGAYVAFNRAIVDEARERMPRNVTASTAHSLAMRAVGSRYRHRLNSGRVRSDQIARELGLGHFTVTYGSQSKVLQPGYLGGLTMRTILAFCMSADDRPTSRHVPYVDGIDLPDATTGARTYANNDLVRSHISDAVARAWADVQNPDGRLPFKHDHYLKIWERSDPRIAGEFVLFDEAQDASPVMLSAVEQQRHAQLVFVGDSQQQIYEWRGAVNALEKVPAEARAMLTQSFRFGPEVARVANAILGRLGAELRLSGLPSIDSEIIHAVPVRQPDALLCRSNAAAVSAVLQFQREGRTVHLVGGGKEVVAFARAADELMTRGQTYYADLACFVSWGEVVEYVEQDPQGSELALLVKLVEEFGVETILAALDNMPDERHVEIVVSTAHKAKGREWGTVQLAGDFQQPTVGPEGRGEWRLLYVAATRAKQVLDLSLCGPLKELLGYSVPTPAVAVAPLALGEVAGR